MLDSVITIVLAAIVIAIARSTFEYFKTEPGFMYLNLIVFFVTGILNAVYGSAFSGETLTAAAVVGFFKDGLILGAAAVGFYITGRELTNRINKLTSRRRRRPKISPIQPKKTSGGTELSGIDVSYAQGVIDWKAVTGVDFVMIRAGYGDNNVDAQFIRNIQSCNARGIACGVYWFSYAYTAEMARQEAEFCLAAVAPYRLDMPISFDWEYASYDYAVRMGVTPTKALVSEMCHAFCDTVKAAGYTPMNYSNPDYLRNFYDESTLVYPLWLAQWASEITYVNDKADIWIWQYGLTEVSGIANTVDGDIGYKTIISELVYSVAAKIGLKTPEEWINVLNGVYPANPDYVKALFERVCTTAGMCYTDDTLVAVTTEILSLSAPDEWQQIIDGTMVAPTSYMIALFERIDQVF